MNFCDVLIVLRTVGDRDGISALESLLEKVFSSDVLYGERHSGLFWLQLILRVHPHLMKLIPELEACAKVLSVLKAEEASATTERTTVPVPVPVPEDAF
jgi:hypothetical protein